MELALGHAITHRPFEAYLRSMTLERRFFENWTIILGWVEAATAVYFLGRYWVVENGAIS